MRLSATAILTRPATTPTYTTNYVVGDANGSATLVFKGFDQNRGLIITDFSLLIGLSALPANMGGFRAHFYSAPPTPVADNTLFDIADVNDNDAYEDFITLATPSDAGSRLFVKERGLNIAVDTGPFGEVYAKLVTIGNFAGASGTLIKAKMYALPLI